MDVDFALGFPTISLYIDWASYYLYKSMHVPITGMSYHSCLLIYKLVSLVSRVGRCYLTLTSSNFMVIEPKITVLEIALRKYYGRLAEFLPIPPKYHDRCLFSVEFLPYL